MSCEHEDLKDGFCPDCEPFLTPAPAAPLPAQVAACIAATVKSIEARLRAKGPMRAPDAEWTRLQDCAQALRNAARELDRAP